MAKLNLRALYPWYTKDEFIEITDEAAAIIFEDLRRENAHQRMVRRYKANCVLDCQDEVDFATDDKNKTPLNILIENLDKQLLYSAIAELPDKQAKRLYAFFFLEMNTNEIAKAESVSKQSVNDSLASAVRNLKKSLKNKY